MLYCYMLQLHNATKHFIYIFYFPLCFPFNQDSESMVCEEMQMTECVDEEETEDCEDIDIDCDNGGRVTDQECEGMTLPYFL